MAQLLLTCGYLVVFLKSPVDDYRACFLNHLIAKNRFQQVQN